MGITYSSSVLFLCRLLLIIFLVLAAVRSGPSLGKVQPKCGMCNAKNEVSCGDLLWGRPRPTNASKCTLWLPPNAPSKSSPECEAVKFDHGVTTTATNLLGTVSLKPYFYEHSNTSAYTAFNITVSNITWTDLWLRFQRIGQPSVNFCRHFSISTEEPVPAEAVLFYDCLWHHHDYKGFVYVFEYSASNETTKSVGKFIFQVPTRDQVNPKTRYLNQSKIFSYVDVSDWPLMKLRVRKPQEDFHDAAADSIRDFVVTLHHNKTESYVRSLKLSPSEEVIDRHELLYEYDTRYEGGDYYFTVQIEHENCSLYTDGCAKVQTPRYSAPDDFHLRILVLIVGCGGALLVTFILVFSLWRWAQKVKSGNLPTVLIIYKPTTTTHMKCAEEFAKFLQSACYINALLDVAEIPKTPNQDPFVWCNNAFERADFVMVLSSPYQECNTHEGIYRNIDVLGLRHLKEKLGDKKCKQQFLSVILPYCTEKDLPSEVKNIKQFMVPKDLVKLLNFLHSNTYQCDVELEEDGAAFLEAMSKAGAEVVARKCICVSGEGHKVSIDELDTVDLTPSKDSSEDLLLPHREKISSDVLNMYPGPLENLNLLGTDGKEVPDVANQEQTTKKIVVDLDDLEL